VLNKSIDHALDGNGDLCSFCLSIMRRAISRIVHQEKFGTSPALQEARLVENPG